MNITEYISSGIVESYVLGLATEEERAEFERMSAAHEQVRRAREEFELALEKFALQGGTRPPHHLKSRIFSEIDVEQDRAREASYAAPADGSTEETTNRATVPLWWRYVAAASIVLLLGSAILNIYLYNQYQQMSNQKEALIARMQQSDTLNRAFQAQVSSYQRTLDLMKDPNMEIVKLIGTNVPDSPDSSCVTTIYWNKISKDVYLVVNKMPQAGPGMQYQLWALVNGQPIDAGVFDVQDGMIKMKNISRANAFAITREREGGSDQPTMHEMYVMGKV